jgi:hypothetical protein
MASFGVPLSSIPNTSWMNVSAPMSSAGGFTGAASGAAGASGVLGGLGAALGPIGWAGLGLQAVGTIGSLLGGGAAAAEAEKKMNEQREYAFGTSLAAQEFPRYFDFRDMKRELSLANSPAFRSAESFAGRQKAFKDFAGKYGPAMARLSSGSFYGN